MRWSMPSVSQSVNWNEYKRAERLKIGAERPSGFGANSVSPLAHDNMGCHLADVRYPVQLLAQLMQCFH